MDFEISKVGKIACVFFIYYNTDIIKKSIECILKHKNVLDIYVVENKSPYTDTEIKPYMMKLLEEGSICKYVIFEENITNNALKIFLNSDLMDFDKYQYTILTDGDIFVYNDDWLHEELNILEKHKKVSVCGMFLTNSNPPHMAEHEDYYFGYTGMWLLLLRTPDLKNFLEYMNKNNKPILDHEMHLYFVVKLKLEWAKTKKCMGYHLIGDLFKDSNYMENPYLKFKRDSGESLWYHNRVCDFEVFSKEGSKKYKMNN